MVLALLAISSSVQGTTINVRSQCSFVLTACDQSQNTAIECYVLNNGDSHLINVGTAWTGGLVWGFPENNPDTTVGNNAKPEADLAEFTIGASNGQDSYDLSNVNAYNLPLQIDVTSFVNGQTSNGLTCGSPTCTIPNLTTFCQSPNTLTGDPGDGCYNHDGTGNVATPGTEAFANACPDAYSFSTDNANHVYGCDTGSNYEVVFCP